MGLSAQTKHALRTSLGISATAELIPLLDLLSDEAKARAAREKEADVVEPAAEPTVPAPSDPPAEETPESALDAPEPEPTTGAGDPAA